MLRRVDSAKLAHRPNIFGNGPFILILGRRELYVRNKRKWTKAEVQQAREYMQQRPGLLANYEGKQYWHLNGRTFSDNENLTQEQVHALLITRDQRNQRKLDRAVAMVQQGQQPRQVLRGHISDEVKQFIWQRDRGRCRNCGSNTELQFDHIIPVAMGGSSEAENLQLLCGPCNRMKGAGLTTRGNPA